MLIEVEKTQPKVESLLALDTKTDLLSQVDAVNKYQLELINLLNSRVNEGPTTVNLGILTKAIISLSDSIKSTVFKKKELLDKDTVDFSHPKIQKAFELLIGKIIEEFRSAGAEETLIQKAGASLSVKLIGFEDKLHKEINSVTSIIRTETNNLPTINKDT